MNSLFKGIPEGEWPSLYLGDAVYASFDGYHIWLLTGSHHEHEATNKVALEPEVFDALLRYQREITRELERRVEAAKERDARSE